jgi:hypothetical protein
VRYEVEDLTTRARTVEVVAVDRPLRSRRLSGATGSATTEHGVFARFDGHWRQVAAAPPGEVGQDLRLTAALAWAANHRQAVRDGTASIAGRPCTWWLTKEPLDIAVVASATAADRTRSCVDAEGLLLADTWREAGRDLRRRTATSVRGLHDLDVFDGTTPQPLPDALVLTEVESLPAPVEDLVSFAPPPGLALRAAARSSERVPGGTEVTRRSVRAVYADDRDLLVLDQVRGQADATGVAVSVPGLGAGHVQATGGGLVLAVDLGPDQLLRVRTSLSYDVLLAWLAGVRRR